MDSNALYERATEVDKMLEVGRMKEICKPLNLDMYPGSLENYQVRLCVFDIPDEVLAIVPELEKWRQSMIFQKIWEQKASDIQQGTDLNMAILKVWNTVKSTWLSLCTQFANGSATFRLVQKHVLMFDRDSKKIKREFKLMCADVQSTAWIEERVMQLNSYEVLQDCQKAADIILDIKDIYDISGNFAPVQAVKLLVGIILLHSNIFAKLVRSKFRAYRIVRRLLSICYPASMFGFFLTHKTFVEIQPNLSC